MALVEKSTEPLFMDNEDLSPSTKYFLTINNKNSVALLNETIVKKGQKVAVFDITSEAKG